MNEEEFGSTSDYLGAFQAILGEGISENHMALLRAHWSSPDCTTTWARLAEAVGYSNGSSVNLQYGKFAERVARKLGLTRKPVDPNGTEWWLWAMVRWAGERDPDTGHTAFVLRRPVIDALGRLGLPRGVFELLSDELNVSAEMREGGRCRVLVNVYERNSEARKRCIAAHGTACCVCGFNFGAMYGPVGEGYIHVHHIVPLSEVRGEYVVEPMRDLRPVCPNCHAVIHLRTPPYTIEELRKLLRAQSGGLPHGCSGPKARPRFASGR